MVGECYVLAAIEGNGSRPSHKGSGINDGKKMYTLNSTEVHGVVCRITGLLQMETEQHGKDRMGSRFSSTERLKGTWDRISGRKSSDPQGGRHGCGTDTEEGYDISKENRTVDGEFPPRQL